MNKLKGEMQFYEMMMIMSEGNPEAIRIISELIQETYSLSDIFVLDHLNIRGSKIVRLYKDCAEENMDKLNRTLLVLAYGTYTEREIQGNLNGHHSIPFIDDRTQREGISTYGDTFTPINPLWNEYVEENRKLIAPRIEEKIKADEKEVKEMIEKGAIKTKIR